MIEVKNEKELKSLVTFVMCNDRPVDEWADGQRVVREFANQEAKRFGYTDWVDAYHKL